MNQQLEKHLETLPQTKADALKVAFVGYLDQISQAETIVNSLQVTDASQVEQMKLAKEYKQALAKTRIAVEKKRKELKDESLREGQTIDAVAKALTNLIVPLEKRADELARFVELKEAAEREARKSERLAQIAPFGVLVNAELVADMDAETWEAYYNGLVAKDKAAKEEAARAEAARIEAERKEAEDRERVRLENEALKAQIERERKEAEAAAKLELEKRAKAEAEFRAKVEKERREAEAKFAEERAKIEAEKAAERAKQEAERKEAEAKAKAEREAREKVEAALREKEAAERKAREDAEEKERKAKAAPDKEKLLALAGVIAEIKLPEMSTKEAEKVVDDVKGLLLKVESFIKGRVEKL